MPHLSLYLGSMSTTGTEMLVETSVMETTENTVETTVKPIADRTTESVAVETEATNGTLHFIFNYSTCNFTFIYWKIPDVEVIIGVFPKCFSLNSANSVTKKI